MKCDIIAEGIIKAASEVKISCPVIVRLTGTNADKAFKMVDEFAKKNADKIKIIVQSDFDKAATAAVENAAA